MGDGQLRGPADGNGVRVVLFIGFLDVVIGVDLSVDRRPALGGGHGEVQEVGFSWGQLGDPGIGFAVFPGPRRMRGVGVEVHIEIGGILVSSVSDVNLKVGLAFEFLRAHSLHLQVGGGEYGHGGRDPMGPTIQLSPSGGGSGCSLSSWALFLRAYDATGVSC